MIEEMIITGILIPIVGVFVWVIKKLLCTNHEHEKYLMRQNERLANLMDNHFKTSENLQRQNIRAMSAVARQLYKLNESIKN